MDNKVDKIVMVKIGDIKPNEKNNNCHTDEQKKRAIKIFKETGFRKPLTISNRSGKLIAGHLRLEVAKELGAKELPCMFQDFKDEAEEYAHMTADNALASWSELDLSKVNTEMLDLGPDFDIDFLGIKDFVIEPIEKYEPLTDEDDVPEVINPITKRGDIWLLGNHRLMCGDSTMVDDVEKLMNGEKADLILTDPPYSGNMGNTTFKGMQKLKNSIEHIYNFNPSDTFPIIESFKKDKINIYLFCNKNLIPDYLNYCLDHGRLFDVLTWHKKSFIPVNMNKYYPDTEYIIKIRDKSSVFNSNLSKNGVNYGKYWVLNSPTEDKKTDHPTVKPQEILKDCLLISSSVGDIVLDLFGGSGSTLICCEIHSRNSYNMELDEKYCDVIINRWQNFTGKKATLETTGQTYEELKAVRNGTT